MYRYNLKQKQLSRMLFDQLKEKFPEIHLVGITPSCEDPEDIWVNIIYPEDEDRQIEIADFAAEISTDILLDYGYSITIMPGDGVQVTEPL